MKTSCDKLKRPLIAVVGPTAVGKTNLVLQIADQLNAEIVNIDSMQIYRYMDIGTAKPSPKELQTVRHHLIDIVNPDDEYNVGRFINDADQACTDIISCNKIPILTGGTGLYLKGFQEGVFDSTVEETAENTEDAMRLKDKLEAELAEKGRAYLFEKLREYDSVSAERIHPNDTYRLLRALQIYRQTGIPWSTHLAKQQQETSEKASQRSILKIGLTCDREQLYERINLRTEQMFEIGLLEEVQKLLDMGYGPGLKPMQSIGYRHSLKFLNDEWDKDETIRVMARDTRRYAKRQYTWFKKDPQIKWFNPDQGAQISKIIDRYLDKSI